MEKLSLKSKVMSLTVKVKAMNLALVFKITNHSQNYKEGLSLNNKACQIKCVEINP